MINEYFKMLGHKVRSLITGEEGIVVSVSFDLNGCVQACVNLGFDKEGKRRESAWHDTKSLEILAGPPVYKQPDFVNVPGGRELPLK